GAAILFEYQTFFPLPTTTATIPAGVSALAGRADTRAVFGVPWDNLVAAKTDLYYQTVHNFPLIAGQVTRQTPVDPAKLNLLQTFDPALLDAAGADVVLIHRAFDNGSLERLARERLGEPFYVDNTIALFDTPAPADPPTFGAILPPEGEIESAALALYAPENGWALFALTVAGDGRAVTLLLDGQAVGGWTVDGTAAITVPLPLAQGFTSARLTLDPPCPLSTDPALTCATVDLSAPAVAFTPAPPFTSTHFERGIELANAYVPESVASGDPLPVWLDWRFTQARNENEIRYVHVLDAAGMLVGQQDNTLGGLPSGTRRVEQVTISFETPLAPGDYRVTAGWYTYPEIAPFCVLQEAVTGRTCGGEVEVTLGTFRVE
ncbi:MAG: hypothetical protein IAE80_27205, partial [Anaerolinea sp.]|nr:hypothetical protein [Anaerolinea sp.]